jgi:hypothetical protein
MTEASRRTLTIVGLIRRIEGRHGAQEGLGEIIAEQIAAVVEIGQLSLLAGAWPRLSRGFVGEWFFLALRRLVCRRQPYSHEPKGDAE